MGVVEIGAIRVYGIGGSKFREATFHGDGNMGEVNVVPTPQDAQEFVGRLGHGILRAQNKEGCDLVVVCVPGPVAQESGNTIVGPLQNVPPFSKSSFNLHRRLSGVDPSLRRKIANGEIQIVGGNDGNLAVQAAAFYSRTANSTKHPVYSGGEDPDLEEWGHVWEADDPDLDLEKLYGMKNIEERLGLHNLEIPAKHSVWRGMGRAMAKITGLVALVKSPDLLVYSGGGAHAYEKWGPHLETALAVQASSSNINLANAVRGMRIEHVPADKVNDFELYGAAGVIANAALRGQIELQGAD